LIGGRTLTTGTSLHYQNVLSTCQQSEDREICNGMMNNITFFVEKNLHKQDEVVVYASVLLETPKQEENEEEANLPS
jgi:hypothetical protein